MRQVLMIGVAALAMTAAAPAFAQDTMTPAAPPATETMPA
ncbi:MAG: porin family protein, partial [Brevundimonas sp.]